MSRAADGIRDRLRALGLDPQRVPADEIERLADADRAAPLTARELLLAAGACYLPEPEIRPWPEEAA